MNNGEGCYPGCYYYTDSCFRADCKKGKEMKIDLVVFDELTDNSQSGVWLTQAEAQLLRSVLRTKIRTESKWLENSVLNFKQPSSTNTLTRKLRYAEQQKTRRLVKKLSALQYKLKYNRELPEQPNKKG